MSQCNKCRLQDIRARARKTHSKVLLRAGDGGMGGTDVFVVPKGEKLHKVKHFAVWLMELNAVCDCD